MSSDARASRYWWDVTVSQSVTVMELRVALFELEHSIEIEVPVGGVFGSIPYPSSSPFRKRRTELLSRLTRTSSLESRYWNSPSLTWLEMRA